VLKREAGMQMHAEVVVTRQKTIDKRVNAGFQREILFSAR